MKKISYIQTRDTIEVVIGGRPLSIQKTHQNFGEIVQALNFQDADELQRLMDIGGFLRTSVKGLTIEEGSVYLDGQQLHGTMVDRLLEAIALKLDPTPIKNFILRIEANPDKGTINDLYKFLEVGKLPIDEEGYFLAYKVVRADYMDKHSGTMKNNPGLVVSENREKVDRDAYRTCSTGLHFCSFEYIMHFLTPADRDRIVLVRVDPTDVVSIPADHNNTKARCWRYAVVADVTDRIKPQDKDSDMLGSSGPTVEVEVEDFVDDEHEEVEEIDEDREPTEDEMVATKKVRKPVVRSHKVTIRPSKAIKYQYDENTKRWKHPVTGAFVKKEVAIEAMKILKKKWKYD